MIVSIGEFEILYSEEPQAGHMCDGCPTIPSEFRKTIVAGEDTLFYMFPNRDLSESNLSIFRIN